MNILVTGASGLIGTALIRELSKRGDDVIIARRASQRPLSYLRSVTWDTSSGTLDGDLGTLDAVVHLAGAGIGNRRWNGLVKDDIYYSRISGTQQIVSAVEHNQTQSVRFISASAIGFYGDQGNTLINEESPSGTTFLAKVTRDWETQAEKASEHGDQIVMIRTGIVLSTAGGALQKQLLPFKFGLGGTLGDGSTWNSWIHIHDEIRAILFLLDHQEITGPVNLCSPNPVTNKQFTQALAKALARPAVMRVPKFALEVALGREMAQELLFCSSRVIPGVLVNNGFEFDFATLDHCLFDLLKK